MSPTPTPSPLAQVPDDAQGVAEGRSSEWPEMLSAVDDLLWPLIALVALIVIARPARALLASVATRVHNSNIGHLNFGRTLSLSWGARVEEAKKTIAPAPSPDSEGHASAATPTRERPRRPKRSKNDGSRPANEVFDSHLELVRELRSRLETSHDDAWPQLAEPLAQELSKTGKAPQSVVAASGVVDDLVAAARISPSSITAENARAYRELVASVVEML